MAKRARRGGARVRREPRAEDGTGRVEAKQPPTFNPPLSHPHSTLASADHSLPLELACPLHAPRLIDDAESALDGLTLVATPP